MKETIMEIPNVLGVLPWTFLLLIGIYVWALILPIWPDRSTIVSWVLLTILMAVISGFTVFVDPKIPLGFLVLFIGGLMNDGRVKSAWRERISFAMTWVGLYMLIDHVVSLVVDSGYPMLGILG